MLKKLTLKKASTLIAFGNISKLIMPFYISYAFHQAQDIFNAEKGLDVFNVYLLLGFTLATGLIILFGAIAKKSGDDICECLSSEYVIRNIANVLNVDSISSIGKQQITAKLIRLKSRADSLFKLKAGNISDKFTLSIFVIVIVLVEGIYSLATITFAILSYISTRKIVASNSYGLDSLNSSLQENNDNLRLDCIIEKKKPLIILGFKWDKILIKSMVTKSNSLSAKEDCNNDYQSHLKSLSLVERLCTVCIVSIGIMSSSINQSEYVLYLLLAGRLIIPSASIARYGIASDTSDGKSNDNETDIPVDYVKELSRSEDNIKINNSNSIVNASIDENISLGVTSSAVGKKFLQLTSAGAWINSLPMGINTTVDKNSKAIPKHIRQLIAVARIVTFQNPKSITIVDPENWLHPTTYKEITTALKAINIPTLQSRTTEYEGRE